MRNKKKRQSQAGGGEELIGLFAGFLTFYLIAEFALSTRPHPLHWLVAAAGMVIGYFVIFIWLRLRRGNS